MDTAEVQTLLEDLGGNIDDLETSLEPLIKASLSTTTSRLPLLDKAKLYVLATYAIESILFSYLRLNGVDAKEHAVFRELTRVKDYFEKVKAAEAGPIKPTSVLDKSAAARFIKQGLAGNDRYDQQHAVRGAAKRKAEQLEQTSQWGSHNRFESTAKRLRAQEPMVTVVKADEASEEEIPATEPQVKMSKKEKKAARLQLSNDTGPSKERSDRASARRQHRMDVTNQRPVADAAGAQDNTSNAAEPTRAGKAVQSSHGTPESLHRDQDEPHQTSNKKRKRGKGGNMRQELQHEKA